MYSKITSIDERLYKLKNRLKRSLTHIEIEREKQIYSLLKFQGNKCAICDMYFDTRNKYYCDYENVKNKKLKGIVCKRCDNGLRFVVDEIMAERIGLYHKYNGSYGILTRQFDTGIVEPAPSPQPEQKPIADWFTVKDKFRNNEED